jgi:HTH-type transcriptional regulator/antitoxin HigA
MTPAQIDQAKRVWPSLSEIVKVPHSEKEYREMLTLLDNLMDEVGENEGHVLASLMEVTSLPKGKTIRDLIYEGRKR